MDAMYVESPWRQKLLIGGMAQGIYEVKQE
jgi:hypothetical protein